MTDELREKITRVCDPAKDGWTDVKQGLDMAEAVLALRPAVSVEIGVYTGKGLICLALAHKANGFGNVIGIDPFSATASAQDMTPEHKAWWSGLDHDRIYDMAKANIARYGVEAFVELVRMKSEDAPVPKEIGCLRIDGNHGPTCMKDVRRFAPSVVVGGTVWLDDVNWPNGPLQNGADEDLADLGFTKTGEIGSTYIFKRTRK